MLLKSSIAVLPVALLGACATSQNAPSQPSAVTAAQAAPTTQGSTVQSEIAGLTWKAGQSCTFEYNHNGKKVVRTETAVRVDGNKVVLNLSGTDNPMDVIVDGNRVSNGISIVDGQRLRFEPASQWIQLPLQTGSSWQDDKQVLGETFTANSKGVWKAVGWEKVKVPAGDFRAIKVVLKETFNGQSKQGSSFAGSGTFSYWISPDISCPVKLEYRNSFGEKGLRVSKSATMG